MVSNKELSFVTETVAPLSAVQECFLCFLVRKDWRRKTVGLADGVFETSNSDPVAGLRFRTIAFGVER